jgi:mRNA-degrading endonuclease RelE of RelBE toxin-antitoxin system
MYKKLAASAARFHWGSKVGVGVAGTIYLDEIDKDVYEGRKTQRRFDLGDLIRAAGLTVDATSDWRVECLSAARSELGRIPEKQYKAILAAAMKLWRSPKKKTQQNRCNEQLRRFKINSYRISFCIEPPSHVIVFRVVAGSH